VGYADLCYLWDMRFTCAICYVERACHLCDMRITCAICLLLVRYAYLSDMQFSERSKVISPRLFRKPEASIFAPALVISCTCPGVCVEQRFAVGRRFYQITHKQTVGRRLVFGFCASEAQKTGRNGYATELSLIGVWSTCGRVEKNGQIGRAAAKGL